MNNLVESRLNTTLTQINSLTTSSFHNVTWIYEVSTHILDRELGRGCFMTDKRIIRSSQARELVNSKHVSFTHRSSLSRLQVNNGLFPTFSLNHINDVWFFLKRFFISLLLTKVWGVVHLMISKRRLGSANSNNKSIGENG